MNFLDSIEDKSFISFTYDGKAIEEFGMAVVSSGDRLSTSIHPSFNNTISTVPGRTGSIYWGTNITGLSFNFKLATDSITSRQLLNFKSHFRPGKIAKFSLAEAEYCYAYAVIDSASTFEFIPFDTTTIINGIGYSDTVYKGEANLTFYIPDIFFYSDEHYIFADDYVDKPWIIASGLPFKSSIIGKSCFLSNGMLLNSSGVISNVYDGGGAGLSISDYEKLINSGYSDSKNNTIINCLYSRIGPAEKVIYAYNAGNMPAQADICFIKTFLFDSGYSVPWNDITIGDTVLGKPRMFKDIDYTISLLNLHSSSWEENKTKVLIDLRDNLDSGLREELIGIVNATGANLQWISTEDAIAAIRNIINNKKFVFSINGIENQTLMGAELTVHVFNNPITTITKEFVENIGDTTNGKYITIKESEGLKEDGTVELQAINMSEVLDDIGVFFLNTYFV